jgi:hypothetical protein
VEEHAGVKIMQREMELIANKEGSWGTGDDENIMVRGSTVTREVTATYLKVRSHHASMIGADL